jgi:hypothetical protein
MFKASDEKTYAATKDCAEKIFSGSSRGARDVSNFLEMAISDVAKQGQLPSKGVMVVTGLVESLGGASMKAEHAKALVSWVNGQSNQKFKLEVFQMLGQVVGAAGAESSKTPLYQTVSRELSRSSFFPSPRARMAACLDAFKEAQRTEASQQMLILLSGTPLPGPQTPSEARSQRPASADLPSTLEPNPDYDL